MIITEDPLEYPDSIEMQYAPDAVALGSTVLPFAVRLSLPNLQPVTEHSPRHF